MPNNPDLLAIIDLSTGKTELTGNRDMIYANITDSHARNQALLQLAVARADHAATETRIAHQISTLRADQLRLLASACDQLRARLNAYIARRDAREAEEQAEEQARIAAMLQALPDPDNPGTADDLVAAPGAALQPHPPVNEQHNDPSLSDTSPGDPTGPGHPSPRDAATGVLPKELDIPIGPSTDPELDPRDLAHPQQPQQQPTSVSLW
jgi:hypothetical protein